MFIGESLAHIRMLNDLSRSQLAEKIDVSEQAIWQYENGYASPKLEVVNKLKNLFKVKSMYFYKEDMLKNIDLNNIKIENIAYRSDIINSVYKTQGEKIYLHYVEAFMKLIESKIKYPKNLILDLRAKAIDLFQMDENIDRKELIKSVAKMSREFLGMPKDSNQNLLFVLEKSGIFIFEKEIGEKIDAYSLWSECDRAYIVLGTLRKSAVRRNFDLAHELGHLLLHHKEEFINNDKKTYNKLEKEADLFASEFLIPSEEFEKDFEKIPKKSNPKAYLELKVKWSVSLQALAVKAYRMGLIDYQQYRYFFMSINKYDYKKVEPLDDMIVIKRPSKVKSILQLLFEKNLLSVEELLNKLLVDLSFITHLTGIEEEFFIKYTNSEKEFALADLELKSK